MPKRNKKVIKLRLYRDKLIARIVHLEAKSREHTEILRQTRKALQKEDTLRAYAIISDPDVLTTGAISLSFLEKNDAIAELTLVYKMLAIERNYTFELGRALNTQDLLRMAALTADHTAEQVAHDKLLSSWSKDHGFTKSLREEIEI